MDDCTYWEPFVLKRRWFGRGFIVYGIDYETNAVISKNWFDTKTAAEDFILVSKERIVSIQKLQYQKLGVNDDPS